MSIPVTLPGIHFDPDNYQQLLSQKSRTVRELLAAFDPPPATVVASPVEHFRMRAEFRIWHETTSEGSRCHYVMFDAKQSKKPVKIERFPIVNQSISQLMAPLLVAINNNFTLHKRLFQIEFLSNSTDELLVTLIYHKQLDDSWEQQAALLQKQFHIAIIGRARKQKRILLRDYVTEQLIINGQPFFYQQKENSFTQPNAAINAQMIEWVCSYFLAQPNYLSSDLLELYCGNGNFTLPLAQHFRKVLATEVSKTSIRSAQYNCALNKIDNIAFIRLSSEETSSALQREREFRRLRDINLDDYQFSAVFVDPPRAGLDAQTLQLVSRFDTIAYISCNPETLASNMKELSKTHRVDKLGVFDQFPYTPHCECGVILIRK
jgi:tRNA (uracil-5-)-methyltransferase